MTHVPAPAFETHVTEYEDCTFSAEIGSFVAVACAPSHIELTFVTRSVCAPQSISSVKATLKNSSPEAVLTFIGSLGVDEERERGV